MRSIYPLSICLLTFRCLVTIFSTTTKTRSETVKVILDGEEKTVAQSKRWYFWHWGFHVHNHSFRLMELLSCIVSICKALRIKVHSNCSRTASTMMIFYFWEADVMKFKIIKIKICFIFTEVNIIKVISNYPWLYRERKCFI